MREVSFTTSPYQRPQEPPFAEIPELTFPDPMDEFNTGDGDYGAELEAETHAEDDDLTVEITAFEKGVSVHHEVNLSRVVPSPAQMPHFRR